ncbi:MAG: hypothetical protein KKB37_16325 [Alphaproteobacteria bacterium]|nr:hypothetical protein [Alphaproteobacteria bacterium]
MPKGQRAVKLEMARKLVPAMRVFRNGLLGFVSAISERMRRISDRPIRPRRHYRCGQVVDITDLHLNGIQATTAKKPNKAKQPMRALLHQRIFSKKRILKQLNRGSSSKPRFASRIVHLPQP